MQRWMKVLVMILGLAGLLLVAGGVALATHSNPNELHACVNNSNGLMFFVSDPGSCSPNQTAVTWNQLGVQGPQGPQGLPGPTGPAGPAGVSGWEKVSSSITPDTDGFAKTTVAVCPAGKKALGGGVRALGGGSRKVIGSFPTGSGNGWIGEVAKSDSSDSLGLDVHAICASVAP